MRCRQYICFRYRASFLTIPATRGFEESFERGKIIILKHFLPIDSFVNRIYLKALQVQEISLSIPRSSRIKASEADSVGVLSFWLQRKPVVCDEVGFSVHETPRFSVTQAC